MTIMNNFLCECQIYVIQSTSYKRIKKKMHTVMMYYMKEMKKKNRSNKEPWKISQ